MPGGIREGLLISTANEQLHWLPGLPGDAMCLLMSELLLGGTHSDGRSTRVLQSRRPGGRATMNQ